MCKKKSYPIRDIECLKLSIVVNKNRKIFYFYTLNLKFIDLFRWIDTNAPTLTKSAFPVRGLILGLLFTNLHLFIDLGTIHKLRRQDFTNF